MAEPALTIVIPAYNENRRIVPTLDAVHKATLMAELEVIVVDDGSTDDTVGAVRPFASTHPQVRVIRYERNRGKGYAVRTGMLAANGRIVLFADADGSTPMTELPKVLGPVESGQVDIAIGSRALPESDRARRQPMPRHFMGWTFRQLVRLILMRGFSDTQCGFKAFSREAAQACFSRQTIDGFGFDLEILYVARHLGYRIVEVPVRWLDDPESRVHPILDPLAMLFDLFRIRLRGLRGAYHFPHERKGTA